MQGIAMPSDERNIAVRSSNYWQFRRKELADELLTTEQSYVQSLKVLFSVYASRLGKRVQTIEGFPDLLRSLTIISDLQGTFLLALQQRINEEWSDEQVIADIFLRFAPFFRSYSSILCIHDTVSASLRQHIQEDETLEKILLECRREPECRKHTLQSLLILPIQRIPRYGLLLESLLEVTPTWHADYDSLLRARDLVMSVVTQVNQSAHDKSQQQQLLYIQSKLSGKMSLVAPGRRFLLKSRMFLVMPSSRRKSLKFVLFSDMLLVVRTSFIGRYNLYKRLELSRRQCFRVDDVEDCNLGSSDTSHIGRFRFRVATSDAICVIEATSQAQKDEWVAALQRCLNETEQRIEVEPTLSSSSASSDSTPACPGGSRLPPTACLTTTANAKTKSIGGKLPALRRKTVALFSRRSHCTISDISSPLPTSELPEHVSSTSCSGPPPLVRRPEGATGPVWSSGGCILCACHSFSSSYFNPETCLCNHRHVQHRLRRSVD